ncbi:peroxisomal membrane anchor protein conserved region-domain-containing protein [Dactylonectria macrodidyma]|uniref:Peroxisomal membrane protein PEX14 n=1 Tax=Dactylonectria macrodidyma TaxID=307937 RepID=A0A9P9FFA9_9HYPO|nr:peroxisomal membrane anchor protein conserved region-domain-containing protein [Dactylonectria macrodidyma]
MSDSDSRPGRPSVPSWQRAQPQSDEPAVEVSSATATETETKTETEAQTEVETAPETGVTADSTADTSVYVPEEDKLEVARRFLDDEAVRDAPRDKKVTFLKSKDIDDAGIQTLLGDEPTSTRSEDDSLREVVVPQPPSQSTSTQTSTPTTLSKPQADRAPIVTYPEFLAKPAAPPPLVTTSRLLNTLYGVAGLSTLIYGTGQYVLRPMVDAQTEARTEFHETTVRNLDALVSKLEKTVSVVPPPKKQVTAIAASVDGESDAEDPTEMFHRDMGTQTSPPLVFNSTTTASNGKEKDDESTAKLQADRLTGLTKTLSGLKDEFRSESESMDGIKTLVGVLCDDLVSLAYMGPSTGTFDVYGRTRKPEPEDEIRKVRDNIRRVKGVLLSTRNFPTKAR